MKEQTLFTNSSSESLSIGTRQTRISHSDVRQQTARNLRLYRDGKMVSIAGSLNSSKEDLIQTARDLITFGADVEFHHPGTPSGPAQINNSRAFFQDFNGNQLRELASETASHLEKLLPPAYHIEVSVSRSCSEDEILIQNQAPYRSQTRRSGFSVMLSRNFESEIWSWYNSAPGVLETESQLQEFLIAFAHEIELATLPACDPPAGRYPVLMSPMAIRDGFLPCLEAALQPQVLLNRSSPLSQKLNGQIFNSKISLTSNALHRQADNDGVPHQSRSWFQNGTLQHYPVPLDWSSRMQMEPVAANFDSGLFGDLSLESSSAGPFKEVLKKMQAGVFCLHSAAMTQGNVLSGEASGLMQKAFWVEDGRIIGPIKGRTLSFNLYNALGQDYQTQSEETLSLGQHEPRNLPWLLFENGSLS